MRSCQKPHPRHGDPQSGRNSHIWSFSLRSKEFVPHIKHLTLRTCNGEMSPQNIWFGKPMGLMTRRPKGLQGPETSLKDLVCRLTHPGDQHKISNLKSDQIIHEGDSFANLSVCWRSRGLMGLSSRMEALVGIIFMPSLNFDSTGKCVRPCALQVPC